MAQISNYGNSCLKFIIIRQNDDLSHQRQAAVMWMVIALGLIKGLIMNGSLKDF